jgi:hypothetical protein
LVFVIACDSPDAVVEAGLSVCHPEKNAAQVVSGVQRDTFSGPVRAQESPNCGNLRDFHDNAARFLCNSDCLAERAVLS